VCKSKLTLALGATAEGRPWWRPCEGVVHPRNCPARPWGGRKDVEERGVTGCMATEQREQERCSNTSRGEWLKKFWHN